MMLVNADGTSRASAWQRIEPGTALTPGQRVLIGWQDWLERDMRLACGDLNIGLVLRADDPVEDVLGVAAMFPIIALEFAVFTDGRHYSHARLLKQRGHYQGEVRAIGDISIDQLFFLVRSGFDSIEVPESVDLDLVETTLRTFSDVYQDGFDSRTPAYLRRRANRGARERAGEMERVTAD